MMESAHPARQREGWVQKSRTARENVTYPVPVIGASDVLLVSGPVDRRIGAIAGAQHGRVARRQLEAAGVTRGQIERRLKSGNLIRVHQGVYAVGHATRTELSAEFAALLTRLDDAAAISHLSAARLWRIHSPARTDPEVDILVSGGSPRNRAGIRLHRTARSDIATHLTHLNGLPITTPAQTLLDIAELLTPRELERALDEALALRIVTLRELSAIVAAAEGRHGRPLLAALIDHRGPSTITRSRAEERLLALIRSAGFPPPECNAQVGAFTVDFLWRDLGVAIEVDGYQWHASRSAFERDRRKSRALDGAGIGLLRVTWEQMETASLPLIADISRRLTQAGIARGRG